MAFHRHSHGRSVWLGTRSITLISIKAIADKVPQTNHRIGTSSVDCILSLTVAVAENRTYMQCGHTFNTAWESKVASTYAQTRLRLYLMSLFLFLLFLHLSQYTLYKQEQVTRCLGTNKELDLNLIVMLINTQESNLENRLDLKIPQVLDQVLLPYPIFRLKYLMTRVNQRRILK